MEEDFLIVEGARVHNLKAVNVRIPRNKLVVFTGLSGSGKSSLAFDTIYAEGQRRYVESFAAYARQFLGTLERPDVDNISGLSPVISIEQKTVGRNPRSTVGTITEVYDYLRLLYSKVATAYSYVTGEKMVKYSSSQIRDLILQHFENEQVNILAPVIKGRKGHYRELFQQIQKQGFVKVRVDGEILDIKPRMQLDRYKIHDIEIVIDRMTISDSKSKRLMESVELALKRGKGGLMIHKESDDSVRFYSRQLMCPTSGISYDDPAPNFFSFNSPYGACPTCHGLGEVSEIDAKKIIPDRSLSIAKGGIAPLKTVNRGRILGHIEAIGKIFGFDLKTPLEEVSEEGINYLLFGSDSSFTPSSSTFEFGADVFKSFEGIANFIIRQFKENPNSGIARWAHGFMNKKMCPECEGARLRKEAYHFKIKELHIGEAAALNLVDLQTWVNSLNKSFTDKQMVIASEVIKEIQGRLSFLMDVGLGYLSLNRGARTLSGGEAQRIRLATQIGAQLVGVLYILDEPSIGLHQRDNDRLIQSLKKLRDIGNSILVVEHDKEIMMQSDWIFDIGPMAGVHGGEIAAEGTPMQLLESKTLTANYLNGNKEIAIPKKRRKGSGESIQLTNATGHNLKGISPIFPLGTFICITGVSGSGKSSLINQTLVPLMHNSIYRTQRKSLPCDKIKGLENIDKIIEIDQSPIGRTPRSNPATYTGVFTEIRNLFSILPEAKIRGYKPGRFSFNVKGGRCEECQGAGVRTIEMNFLPDVFVECNVCNGKRYNRETLEVRYRGKSIGDVLEMTVEQGVEFFENIPKIYRKIKTIRDVGLGYIKIGQPSTTLSGGEAQRMKLAAELSKTATGKTFYVLDEPTTGLHFEDIRILLDVLNKLVDKGNTVVVIEHNLDIIKVADHIIDIGPEGGNQGGEIMFEGTPEKMIKNSKGYTSTYLDKEINGLPDTVYN